MIDTVCITNAVPMHRPAEMLDLLFSPRCGHTGRDCRHAPRWKLNPPEIAATHPRLTWNRAPDGVDYLSASVSIPKLLFGSNVEMLESQAEIDRALMAVSRYVSEVAKVNFDAFTANVTRVDFCYIWKLTPTEVCEYLRVIGRASLSRMKRHLIEDNTVQFSNKSQTVAFYDKLEETLSRLHKGKATDEEVKASVGVLRFERRFLTYRACERLAFNLGLPDRRAETLLRTSIAETAMNKTIRDLGLDQTLEGGDVRLARLLQEYGPKRALPLAGLLAACDSYGADNLVRFGISKRSTFHRMRREIKLAGAWIVSDRERPLPPLRLIQPREQARVA